MRLKLKLVFIYSIFLFYCLPWAAKANTYCSDLAQGKVLSPAPEGNINPEFVTGQELSRKHLALVQLLRDRDIDPYETHVPEFFTLWKELIVYARNGIRKQRENFLTSSEYLALSPDDQADVLVRLGYRGSDVTEVYLGEENETKQRRKKIENLHRQIKRFLKREELTYRRFFYAWFKLSVLLTPTRHQAKELTELKNFSLPTDRIEGPREKWEAAGQTDILDRLESGEFKDFWVTYRDFETYVNSPRREDDLLDVSDWYVHKSLSVINDFPNVIALPVFGIVGQAILSRGTLTGYAPVGLVDTIVWTETTVWFSDFFTIHDLDHWEEVFGDLALNPDERSKLMAFGRLLDRDIAKLPASQRRQVEDLLYHILHANPLDGIMLTLQTPETIEGFLSARLHIPHQDLPEERKVNISGPDGLEKKSRAEVDYKLDVIRTFVPLFNQIHEELGW